MDKNQLNNAEDKVIEHECGYKNIPNCRILYGPSIDSDWQSWILELTRTARSQDVIDGEAESIGDLICSHQFVIKFCPFCGRELLPQ